MIDESAAASREAVAAVSFDRLAARVVLHRLQRWRVGAVTIELPDGRRIELGEPRAARRVTVAIRRWRFFRRVLLDADVGAGEAYMDGDWECSDLVEVCRMFAEDQDVLDQDSLWTLPMRLTRKIRRWAEANSLRGSRRNIQRHYDLSNELFGLFLDESMTYSAAVFEDPAATLEQAQRAKLDGVCRQLQLDAAHRVLEIGSGWGAFAIHAARTYGCRVLSITLSEDQLRLARARVAAAGLSDRVEVRLCDYRQVEGSFDRIVSIEMFEAVGLRYYDTFFSACERLLRPAGSMFLQTIAFPDQGFAAYARDYDWSRKHIFPGSLLASLHEISASLQRVTTLRIESLRDIGLDYARTLRLWRERFLSRRVDVRRLGFDDRFVRMWEFYLASCEAAFSVRYINNLQLVLRRPLPFARRLAAARRLAS